MQVLMFDTNSQPKISPGETLHPGIEPLLKQLQVLDQILQAGFHRHRGVWFEQGGLRDFIPYGENEYGSWLGFQADRRIFLQILQQAAIDAKVSLVRNAEPEIVLLEGKRVIGMMVKGKPFHAPWTVDATGRSAWLARKLTLPVKQYSPPLGVRFGWRNEKLDDLDGQPLFAFCKNGWDWYAPLGRNRSAWVELRIAKNPGDPPEGIDLSWKIRPDCAGPGYVLLGDAAATLDPSSSHGVLRALMSGILCSHLVEAYLGTHINETDIIEAYRNWVGTQFENDEKHLRRLYNDSPAGQRFSQGEKLHK